MKVIRIKLENYVGIFNGRGDNVLEIDLSNTKNIVIIRGHNGSGKSTLLKALSPMPDPNDQFIAGAEAKKTITYRLDNGNIVEIRYTHPIKGDGTRGTTKAQVLKNGENINPTNNVSDAKEIIFSLFNIDTNFLTLSQLSSDDRGLADKKPSERKSFVNSIISGVDVYNSMYKTINKKYSMYKSLISSINMKIKQIGNKEELDSSFFSVNKELENTIKDRDIILSKIASLKSKLEENNSDSIVHTYNENIVSIKRNAEEISSLISSLNPYYELDGLEKDNSFESLSNEYNSLEHRLSSINNKLIELNTKLNYIKSNRSETYENEQKLIIERASYIDEGLSESIINQYNEAEKEIHLVEENIKEFNYILDDKDMINSLIDLLSYIFDYVSSMTDGLMSIDYISGFNFIKSNRNNKENHRLLESYRDDLLSLKNKYSEYELEENTYTALLEQTKKLSNRPKGCKFDDCVFIKDAIEALNKNPEKKLDELYKLKSNTKTNIASKEKDIEQLSDYMLMSESFDKLMNKINSFKTYLDKVNMSDIYDENFIISLGLSNNFRVFKERRDKLNEYYNLLTIKDTYKNTISKYSEAIGKYNKNKEAIDSLNSKIEELKEKVSSFDITIKELENSKSGYESFIKENTSKFEVLKDFILNKKDKVIILRNDSLIKEKDNVKLEEAINKISSIDKDLKEEMILSDDITAKYNELLKRRDQLSYNKIMIEKYLEELDDYSSKFEKIETIRYYVSPTTGIQTVFIGAYMNNIIIKANELLSLIFNGQFVIQPFVINESEFRIPCLGSGIMNDDISSMSTSQICMISMIISFAILSSANTDYNILKLDEIDGGLDTENRIQFIELLTNLIQVVNCEQCFLISHNMEYSSNASVINLSSKPIEIM